MSKLREIRENRKAAADGISQLADTLGREKRDFAGDEKARWDRLNADFDRLGREERAEQVRDEQTRLVGDSDVGRDDFTGRRGRKSRDNVVHTEEQRGLAFRAWIKQQLDLDPNRREREACKALRFNPASRQLRLGVWPDRKLNAVRAEMTFASEQRRGEIVQREQRANMSAQLDTAGGYLVSPGSLINSLEVNQLAFGGALQVADIMTTTSGEPMFWPTADDTANAGALLGENTQAMSSGTNPALAQKRYDAYKFTSTPILVPSELLEDSQFDIPSLIGEMLGTRLGRGQAPYLATGTGSGQPEGIVTGAALGVTAASATAFTFDELIRLELSIDPAYRSMPGVGWMMHDGVRSYVRRLKDGNGRMLWVSGENYQTGYTDGAPERLLNYPVNVCQELAPTVATGNKTVLFGRLSQFKVRKTRDVRLFRLQERFRDLDQDGFVAFQRMDAKILQAGTNPIKYLQQA